MHSSHGQASQPWDHSPFVMDHGTTTVQPWAVTLRHGTILGAVVPDLPGLAGRATMAGPGCLITSGGEPGITRGYNTDIPIDSRSLSSSARNIDASGDLGRTSCSTVGMPNVCCIDHPASIDWSAQKLQQSKLVWIMQSDRVVLF